MNVPAIAITALLRLRAFLVPIALFGLVVLGLHAGSDRLDDLAFQLINVVDRFIDGVVARVLETVLGTFGASERTVARWTYGAVSLIDLDEKRWTARALALVFELAADALLIWPVLRHRHDRTPWREAGAPRAYLGNVGAAFAPIAVALASLAGAIVVAQQAQLQLFWYFRFLGRPGASRAAGVGALIVLALVTWRLVAPAVRAGLAFGRTHARHHPWYRGWWLAAPLFVSALAVSPVPLWRTLRGLGPW